MLTELAWWIRKFDRLGRSEELLRLNVSSSQHKYHLTLDPEERFLYMSDPANYRIIRIPLTKALNKPVKGFMFQKGFWIKLFFGKNDQNLALDLQNITEFVKSDILTIFFQVLNFLLSLNNVQN